MSLTVQEDEDDTAPRRGRAVSLARTESDYSPAASPVRKAKAPAQRPRQLQEGRPPAPKGQKEGGPCAVCFATSKHAVPVDALRKASLLLTLTSCACMYPCHPCDGNCKSSWDGVWEHVTVRQTVVSYALLYIVLLQCNVSTDTFNKYTD